MRAGMMYMHTRYTPKYKIVKHASPQKDEQMSGSHQSTSVCEGRVSSRKADMILNLRGLYLRRSRFRRFWV